MEIDLSKCEKGDILVTSLGGILRYISPTKEAEYYDHHVEYVAIIDGDANFLGNGTRMNNGQSFKHKRELETDHDVVMVVKQTILNKPYQLILGNITFHHFDDNELKLFKTDLEQKALIHEVDEIKCFDTLEEAENEADNTHHQSWLMPLTFKGEIVFE